MVISDKTYIDYKVKDEQVAGKKRDQKQIKLLKEAIEDFNTWDFTKNYQMTKTKTNEECDNEEFCQRMSGAKCLSLMYYEEKQDQE